MFLSNTLSHIFAPIIKPLPSPIIIRAIVRSCLSIPFEASMSKIQISLYFIVLKVSLTISFSNMFITFDFFLNPAVSIIDINSLL